MWPSRASHPAVRHLLYIEKISKMCGVQMRSRSIISTNMPTSDNFIYTRVINVINKYKLNLFFFSFMHVLGARVCAIGRKTAF